MSLQKLFYTLAEFQEAGGPGHTTAYKLANLGRLNIVKTLHGRTGITAAEAERYFASSKPIAISKRDTAPGIAASLRSRAAR